MGHTLKKDYDPENTQYDEDLEAVFKKFGWQPGGQHIDDEIEKAET